MQESAEWHTYCNKTPHYSQRTVENNEQETGSLEKFRKDEVTDGTGIFSMKFPKPRKLTENNFQEIGRAHV
mgnify:CR=1 FL=1